MAKLGEVCRVSAGSNAFVPPRPLDDVSDLSELCRALADPTRLQMIQLLSMAERPLCVCEFESNFALSQPTISHHLRILREAGIVTSARKGTWVFYELRPEALNSLSWLEQARGAKEIPISCVECKDVTE